MTPFLSPIPPATESTLSLALSVHFSDPFPSQWPYLLLPQDLCIHSAGLSYFWPDFFLHGLSEHITLGGSLPCWDLVSVFPTLLVPSPWSEWKLGREGRKERIWQQPLWPLLRFLGTIRVNWCFSERKWYHELMLIECSLYAKYMDHFNSHGNLMMSLLSACTLHEETELQRD